MNDRLQQSTARDAALVEAVRAGQPRAFAQLVEAWFDRCWEVSWRVLHDRDRASEVAQDVMLAAWQKLDTLESPGSFGGWVLRMSRNRSLDRYSHERRAIPTGEQELLESREPGPRLGDPEEAAIRAEAHDLVWAAAVALGERDASILDLHLRHGLDARELAAELGIEPNAANQALHRLRGRLGSAIRAHLLWRDGNPRCSALAAALESAHIDKFGMPLVHLVEKHADRCAECTEQRRRFASPVALFAAVPFVVIPGVLHTTSAHALSAQGVPVPEAWAGAGAVDVDVDVVVDVVVDAPASTTAPPSVADTPTRAAPESGVLGRSHRRRLATWSIVVAALLLLGLGIWLVVLPKVMSADAPARIPIRSDAAPRSVSPSPRAVGPSPTPRPPSPRPTETAIFIPPPEPELEPEPSPEPDSALPAPSVELEANLIGVGNNCTQSEPFAYQIVWSTMNAETTRLSGAWGNDTVPLSGEAERCGGEVAEFTITAGGPGGETVVTVESEAEPLG